MSSLTEHLKSSTYILALVGAGLSASSGIATFAERRHWRGQPYSTLASMAAFERDPVSTWQFWEHMRKQALFAQPNAGHLALAQLARAKPEFLAITQNIDGLSEKAGHPELQLAAIHGSLFALTCCGTNCPYKAWNTNHQPIAPALCLPHYDHADSAPPFPSPSVAHLPRCPLCKTELLRPGVVWYGELLVAEALHRIDQWLDSVPHVDLLFVIGTSAHVSSGFIGEARMKGASVAHFNTVKDEELVEDGDWFVAGDAAETLPQIFADAFTGLA